MAACTSYSATHTKQRPHRKTLGNNLIGLLKSRLIVGLVMSVLLVEGVLGDCWSASITKSQCLFDYTMYNSDGTTTDVYQDPNIHHYLGETKNYNLDCFTPSQDDCQLHWEFRMDYDHNVEVKDFYANRVQLTNTSNDGSAQVHINYHWFNLWRAGYE